MISEEFEDEDPYRDHPLHWMRVGPGGLFSNEFFWREHQTWLAGCGYMLRPRYRNDWEPSWLESKQPRRHCEDGNRTMVGQSIVVTSTWKTDSGYSGMMLPRTRLVWRMVV